MNLKAVLEGLLYVAGDDGLKIDEISRILETDAKSIILELAKDYKENDRGLELATYGNRIKIVTKKEYNEYLKKMFCEETNETLSPSALETLAIIAYNEPITRLKVDEIRGVSSSHIIRKLVFKNLVKELGKSDLPGRPLLYGVTEQFLDHFGLSSKEDLPKIETKEVEETPQDLFTAKYKEI